jgi:hypothetical protein
MILIVVPLKQGERRPGRKLGVKMVFGVYMISFSEKFQAHSNHSLIKPCINPINRCDEYQKSISQRNEAICPSSRKKESTKSHDRSYMWQKDLNLFICHCFLSAMLVVIPN